MILINMLWNGLIVAFIIPPLVAWGKKKVPIIQGAATTIVTSALGILFAFLMGLVGLAVFTDQTFWQTFLVGLGVNQTAAQLSWQIYSKLKKPKV